MICSGVLRCSVISYRNPGDCLDVERPSFCIVEENRGYRNVGVSAVLYLVSLVDILSQFGATPFAIHMNAMFEPPPTVGPVHHRGSDDHGARLHMIPMDVANFRQRGN